MFLLDTNVISELRKREGGRADTNVMAWADSVTAGDLFVSVITFQEIEIGILLKERADPRQAAILRGWFTERVIPAFAGRTLAIDMNVALRNASLHVPDPRPVRDGLIAATALVHGLTVVTRNIQDFEPMGVVTHDPWKSV